MRRGLAVLSVVSLLWVGVAGAAVHRGEIDIDFSGTWLSENAGTVRLGDEKIPGLDFDGLFLSGGIGYFLTDHIEVEGAAIGIWFSGNPTMPGTYDWDETFYALGAKAKYHFMPTNRWVPYVGGQFFWGKDDRDAIGESYDAEFDGYLWGPLAGLRFELTEHVDFFVEYQYHIWGGEISDGSVVGSPNWENGHLVTLGLIYGFR